MFSRELKKEKEYFGDKQYVSFSKYIIIILCIIIVVGVFFLSRLSKKQMDIIGTYEICSFNRVEKVPEVQYWCSGNWLSVYTFEVPDMKQKTDSILPLSWYSSFEKLKGCNYFRGVSKDFSESEYKFFYINTSVGLREIPESVVRSVCNIPIVFNIKPSFKADIGSTYAVFYNIGGEIKQVFLSDRSIVPIGSYHLFNRGKSVMFMSTKLRAYLIRDINEPQIELLNIEEIDGPDYWSPYIFGDIESTSVFIPTLDRRKGDPSIRIMKIDPITGDNNYNFARIPNTSLMRFTEELKAFFTCGEAENQLWMIDIESGGISRRFVLPNNISCYTFRMPIIRHRQVQAIFGSKVVDLKSGLVSDIIPGLASGHQLAINPSGDMLCWSMVHPKPKEPSVPSGALSIKCYYFEWKMSFGPVRVMAIEKSDFSPHSGRQTIRKLLWRDDNTLIVVVD